MSAARKTLSFVALLHLSSCSTGSAARAARGDVPGAADTFGTRRCIGPGEDVEPWVVDMPADRRVEVEAEMQKGVVLVHYDCRSFDIVRSCRIAGDYGYTGTTLVEDEVVLEDADSVAANLSLGSALAPKLEAEMKRGMKVHIGYVLVGQRSTTVGRMTRAELRGDCGRVTHFIARSTLGAYAVVASSEAKMGAVAEIFARGGSARSASSAFKSTTAGEKAACSAATPEDGAPPGKCRAPVKLLLSAISEVALPESGPPPAFSPRSLRCPDGMVRHEGACIHDEPGAPLPCVITDPTNCSKRCADGDASSCATLGFMYENGKGVAVDERKAFDHYRRACDAKELDGCVGLAFLRSKGKGAELDEAFATKTFRDACDRGHARACSGLGQRARIEGNGPEAVRWLERSCNLGYARACFYAGSVLSTSGKEPERALKNHEKACTGRDERGCLALAGMLFSGLGAAPDAERANKLQGKSLNALNGSCASGDAEACEVVGDFYDGRYGRKVRKPEKALEFYERACTGGRGDACHAAGVLLEKGDGPVAADPAKSKVYLEQACKRGVNAACR